LPVVAVAGIWYVVSVLVLVITWVWALLARAHISPHVVCFVFCVVVVGKYSIQPSKAKNPNYPNAKYAMQIPSH
jgi:hypothetical protein